MRRDRVEFLLGSAALVLAVLAIVFVASHLAGDRPTRPRAGR